MNLVQGIRLTATKLCSVLKGYVRVLKGYVRVLKGYVRVLKGYVRVLKGCAQHVLEYSPSSANLASDWLRAKRALLWTRKREGIDDGVDTSLASKGIALFVDLWEAQPCLWAPE